MHTQRLSFILQIAFVCFAIILVSIDAFTQYHLLTLPFEINDSEGVVLNQAWRLAHGLALYPPVDHSPYILSVYTPLYPLVVSWFLDVESIGFFAARLLSLMSFAGIGIAVFFILRTLTQSRWWSFAGTVLILCSGHLQSWATLCRVDMLGIFLSLAGLWCYVARRRGIGLIAAYLFCLAALMTKQTLLAAPLAILIDRILCNRRRGIIEAGAFFATLAIAFITLQIASDGHFFGHAFYYVATPLSAAQLMLYLRQIAFGYPVLLIGITILLATPLRRERDLRWLLAYVALGLGAGLTTLKTGAAENHWLEFIIAATLCFAVLGARAPRILASPPSWKPLLIALALLQLGLILLNQNLSLLAVRRADAYRSEEGQRIDDVVRSTPGPILTEQAGWAVRNGKAFLFDAFSFTQMHYQERWDEQPLIDRLDDGEFSLILTQFDIRNPPAQKMQRFTPNILATIQKRYRLQKRIGTWHVYAPGE